MPVRIIEVHRIEELSNLFEKSESLDYPFILEEDFIKGSVRKFENETDFTAFIIAFNLGWELGAKQNNKSENSAL